ncbi:MAG TPA: DUF4382 domain-containing protein [Gammaproteobacteria bacterium]|nr:DUF4382 domain-containing protein [Gammaproteobacteria bacterium]
MLRLIARSAAVLCVLLPLASCGGGGGNTSNLNIYVADAPIDQVNSVNISLSEVDVTGDTGTQYFPFPAVTVLNFYQLQGGLSAFLINLALPAGHYTSITLYFEAAPGTLESNITLIGNGNTYPLVIPAGAPTKFTLPVNFIVFQNINASYTFDLDLRSSVLPDPSNPYQYILQPVLRAVNNTDIGSITGTVATSLVPSGCSPTVYVYSGNVTPTDVNINAPAGTVQPISSALVGLNNTTAIYNFTVGWLPPGLYTVAFTCQANQDNPTTADNILFTPVITATVNANQTTFVTLK